MTLLSHWRLGAHQQLSPALVDKLEFFATVRGSYEPAARLAAKVGCLVALDGSGPVQSYLDALEEARDNGYWDNLWLTN